MSPSSPPATRSSPSAASGTSAAEERAAWNQALNRTHAMAGLRASGGRVVRAIETRRRDLVARAVRARRPRTVVDVGAEDGWVAQAYVGGLSRLVLADIDPEVLARSPLARHPRVELVEADALDPAVLLERVGPGCVDVVVLSALLEHLADPRPALIGLLPLLAPGGCFVIYVPADVPILALKRLLRWTRLGRCVRGLSLEPAPGHLRVFTRRSLVRLLAPVGRVLRVTFDPIALGYLALLAPRATSD